MGEVANQLSIVQASLSRRAVLAADVGGTHARVAVVMPGLHPNAPVEIVHHCRYVGADWPDLASLLRDFVDRHGGIHALGIQRCAIAIAGYVLDDTVTNSNLPWAVSLREIRDGLGIAQLDVVNDFEAVAYASQYIDHADTWALNEGDPEPTRGPVLIMGPGTGLGSAVLLPGRTHPQVMPTEAGQIALAPGNALEMDILRILGRTRAYVSHECVLSGPGLLHTYRAIAELQHRDAPLLRPESVTAAGIDGSDPAARMALDVFCGLLGSFVGDLVMLYGARGGAFLAGGILPQIRDYLTTSDFRARYLNKGVMNAYLERVPVRVVDHGHLGVVGAATYHPGARVGAA